MIKKRGGFTIIELLVVIAIIAIIATIIMVSISGARAKSRDSKRKADIGVIKSSLTMYYDSQKKYSSDTSGWDTSRGNCPSPCTDYPPNSGTVWAKDAGGAGLLNLVPNYIDALPVDPLNKDAYFYYYEPTFDQFQFGINCIGKECAYMLSANLENDSDTSADSGCNWYVPVHDFCLTDGGAKTHED